MTVRPDRHLTQAEQRMLGKALFQSARRVNKPRRNSWFDDALTMVQGVLMIFLSVAAIFIVIALIGAAIVEFSK